MSRIAYVSNEPISFPNPIDTDALPPDPNTKPLTVMGIPIFGNPWEAGGEFPADRTTDTRNGFRSRISHRRRRCRPELGVPPGHGVLGVDLQKLVVRSEV